jgi:SYP7 family syntaxin
MLKEREELLAVKPGSKDAAELSHKIRTKIKNIRDEGVRLKEIQKKEESKKKQSPEDQKRLKEREEIVGLVFKHIEECENLEKKRFADKLNADRGALLTGAAVKIDMVNTSGPTATDLPDIDADPDPEVTRGLQQLHEGDHKIDMDLEQISANVNILKEIAINMDKELGRQNDMLDVIDKKVDKAQIHLDHVNAKMKKALDGVMKGDRFMVSCILLCVLLALAGFVSNMFIK